MSKLTLTAKLVEHAVAPASGRIDLWDTLVGDDVSLPGAFGLRVSASGVKSWVIMYRLRDRLGMLQQRRLVLGTYPAYGL